MREICHADTRKYNLSYFSYLQTRSDLSIVPPNFEELLGYYTHRGYRVIACAAKYEAKLSWMKIQKMSREQAESGLNFLGFIVFENKLKDTTTPVISELREAGLRTVMCTGDNILTAISVARECGLIDPNSPCFMPHLADSKCIYIIFQ
jgi:cation-transporting P-type ATPase 13A2